jgi:hypothetical protein
MPLIPQEIDLFTEKQKCKYAVLEAKGKAIIDKHE